MAYTKQTWADGAAGETPITAARLNHIETGLESAASAADAVPDAGDVSADAVGDGVATDVQGVLEELHARIVALETAAD